VHQKCFLGQDYRGLRPWHPLQGGGRGLSKIKQQLLWAKAAMSQSSSFFDKCISLAHASCFDKNVITCQRGKLVPFHPTDAHHVNPMVAQNPHEIASPCFSRKVLLLNLLGKGYLLGRKEGVIKGRKNWGTNSDRFFRKVELGRVLKRCMRRQHGKAAPSTCFEGLLRHGEGIAMNFRCGRVLGDGNSCKN